MLADKQAEQTVIDIRRSVVLADTIDPVAVAAAMNPAMSSWVALRQRVQFQASQDVLVLGATGAALVAGISPAEWCDGKRSAKLRNDRAVGRGDSRGQGGAAMGEWWAAAVAAAGEQPPADLSAAVAEELIALWSDLGEAIRRAADRSWSVECDGLVVRIVMLSRLTAATPWQWIPVPLLVRGVYQGLLESAGIAFTSPCMAEVYGAGPQAATGELPGAIGRR